MARTPPPPTETPAATPARAWAAGTLVQLPGSGHAARLRKPSLRALLHAGKVPSSLVDSVYRLVQGLIAAPEQPPEQQRQKFMEDSAAFVYVASQCFVEPRLVTDKAPDYDKGEIGPDDLSDLDYIWIFYTWTEGSAEQEAPFRLGAGAGNAGSPEPAVRLAAA
jgi:hypothetical protein